jgi:nitroreductase
MLKDLVLKNRSYRRYYQDIAVEKGALLELVDLARLTPSARNSQPLKYFVSAGEKNAEIFSCLAWAGYLTEWPGPEEGERPTGYIVVMLDKSISMSAENAWIDVGIACQTMLLGAAEKGFGGCMFGAVNRPKLAEILSLPESLEILLVVAIGKPKEEIVLDPVGADGDIKYWRDENQVHHVPKRSMSDILYGG